MYFVNVIGTFIIKFIIRIMGPTEQDRQVMKSYLVH